jgi:hypothetical protein
MWKLCFRRLKKTAKTENSRRDVTSNSKPTAPSAGTADTLLNLFPQNGK